MGSAFRPALVIFAVVLVMAGFTTWRKLSEPKELIPWRKTLAAAKDEAAASKKPVLAYFTATWCEPCQEMKTSTWADPQVEAALREFVPVKIDVDEYPDLANQFNIENIPRLQLIEPDGTLGRAHVGRILPDELLRWLRGT